MKVFCHTVHTRTPAKMNVDASRNENAQQKKKIFRKIFALDDRSLWHRFRIARISTQRPNSNDNSGSGAGGGGGDGGGDDGVDGTE